MEELMRLQRFLARAGVASRRRAEELIVAGRVTVNGQVASELGRKVDPMADAVAVDGQAVQAPGAPVTLMLHKPAGFVTTMDDPQGRPTVASLVPAGEHPGLYPVGRLDADTTGLLLFTTDGNLGHGLLHPRKEVAKSYLALVDGTPTEGELRRLRKGVRLRDGLTSPAAAEVLSGEEAKRAAKAVGEGEGASGRRGKHPKGASSAERRRRASWVRVVIHEGRNRQVRRMLEAVGHPVIALHRESFGPLALGSLPRGAWRELDREELAALADLVQAPGA